VERWESIAERASEVLRDYEQQTGGSAFEGSGNIAESLGEIAKECFKLEVVDSAWLEEGVLGELDLCRKTISISQDLEPERREFTLAHELGHAALNHSERIVDLEEHVDERTGTDELDVQEGIHQAYNSRDLMEVEANLFAAELLVPSRLLREATSEDTAWTVAGLAERFGVSQTLMLGQLSNVLLVRVPSESETEVNPAEDAKPASPPPEMNREQKEAVGIEAPALVVAGPGAGKTRVLAERYARLVSSGTSEDSVLALTFSNKAAGEMRSRVSGILGGGYRQIQAYTFHSFCLELLKGYYHLVGIPEDFTLLTEMDALLLVRGRLPEVGLSYLENLSDPGLYVPGMLTAISRAKDELRSPAEFEDLASQWLESAGSEDLIKASETLEAAKVYAAYEGWLKEGGYVDYGDLIRLGLDVLEHPGAGEEIRDKYSQVLVDEFQDINFASGRLLRALDGGRGMVWAVADPDQSIYGFRGASAANLERFEDDYPGYRPVFLTKNYRSVPDVVDACAGLRGVAVSEAGEGTPPPLESTRPTSETPAVTLLVAPDENAELEYIREEIRQRNDAGVPLRDQAVLCATNNQARKVVARLAAAGLAAQGPTTLLGSGEIKAALAVVSLLRDGDGAGLLAIADFEENPLTERDVVKVLEWSRDHNRPVKKTLPYAAEIEELDETVISFLAGLANLLEEMPAWGDAWQAVMAYVFHPESRIRNLFHDASHEARGRLAQLGQLAVLARSFGNREELVEGEGIPGFMEYAVELAASRKGDSALYTPPERDAVQVMTVHKSKGLEFPVVFVPNLVTRRFPGSGGGSGDIDLPPDLARDEHLRNPEEEIRCLFYVALTRAEDELTLSRAEQYGNRATALPLIDRLVREAGGRTTVAERHPSSQDSSDSSETLGGEESRAVSYRQTKSAYTFRELQRYGECSLQYKFGELLGLPEKRSAYRDFHGCVYRVLGEMELEAREAGCNPSPSRARELLDGVWDEEGPGGHFYESVYRARAGQTVENWQKAGAALDWRVRQGLSLPISDGLTLEVTADAVQKDDDGTVVVARHRFGRPRESHKTKEHLDLLSMYVAAARETWPESDVRAVLHYLVSDETIEVPLKDRSIASRTKKLGQRIERARAGFYPPSPGRACKKCPWNLVCPASV
jgi:DNA helicase II / ATP-dependent DNA helicase PcrA